MPKDTSVFETPEYNVKQADGTFAKADAPEVQSGVIGPSDPPTWMPEPWINKSVEVQRAFNVRFLIGARAKPLPPGAPFTRPTQPLDRTQPVRWHDSTVDILERLSQPTDGTMVLLVPGSAFPFSMFTNPWYELREGATVYVVPNNSQQVGDAAEPTPGLPAAPAEVKTGNPEAQPAEDAKLETSKTAYANATK